LNLVTNLIGGFETVADRLCRLKWPRDHDALEGRGRRLRSSKLVNGMGVMGQWRKDRRDY